MQTVHRHELLRKIERRPKMVHPPVHMRRVPDVPQVFLVGIENRIHGIVRVHVASQAENARPRSENGIPLRRLLDVLRLAEILRRDALEHLPERLHLGLVADAEEPIPVCVHAAVQRLVIEELRGPLRRVNLGDFGGYDQPRRFEQLVRRHILVPDHLVGPGGVTQSGVRIRRLRRLLPEFLHEDVVFPRKDVVVKAHADRPVVRKRGRFLARPVRIDRIAGLEHRQVSQLFALARPAARRLEHHLRAVAWIALHPLARRVAEPVELGRVPPARVHVARRLRRARQVLFSVVCELGGRGGLRDVCFVDLITGPAAQFLDLLRRQRLLRVVNQLRGASDLHVFRRVVTLVEVREPVVRHELDPECRQHVEERRLLVIAVSGCRVARDTARA